MESLRFPYLQEVYAQLSLPPTFSPTMACFEILDAEALRNHTKTLGNKLITLYGSASLPMQNI